MKRAFDLLHVATERFPPPGKCHHSLTLNDSGQPLLTIHIGEKWEGFTLDPEDLDRDPKDIIDQIAAMLAARG